MRLVSVLLGTAIGIGLAAGGVAAQTISNAYSRLNLDRCLDVTPRDEESDRVSYRCKGFKNIAAYDVFVSESDARFYISYGPNAAEQKAAGQTLAPFNSIGDGIEWRLRRRGGDWQPFATILRYFTDVPDGDTFYRGEVLVVAKFAGREACHVAYIDARANVNANRMAREAADRLVRTFDCATDDPIVYGERGRSLGPVS